MWRHVRHLVIIIATLSCACISATAQTATASSQSGLFNSSLGRWLDNEAAPELAKLLSSHPMFKGETVRLVNMRDGRPTDSGNRLNQAIEDHLTQRLLGYPGVRLAWQDQSRICGVPQKVVYLLGVELKADGSRNHKLNIAMVDVSESVWVSGVNVHWQGRLSSAERNALRTAVSSQPAGTIDSPFPVRNGDQIARVMQRHLRCALPQGLDGPLYLRSAESPQTARVLAQLQSELALSPLAAITRNPAEATWLLSIQTATTDQSTHTRQLILLLEDKQNQATQQVASVFVTGLEGERAAPAQQQPANTLIASERHPALLTTLSMESARSSGICAQKRRGSTNRGQSERCMEVSFDLLQPAYLFVMSTSNRQMTAVSCESRLQQLQPGERRYRLRVPEATNIDAINTADAGIYAIAISDRSIARRFNRHLRSAPGICGNRNRTHKLDNWLAELDQLFSEYPQKIQWRALHLANHHASIELL